MFNYFKKKQKITLDDELEKAKKLGLITEGEQLRLQFDRIEKKLKDYEEKDQGKKEKRKKR